MHGNTRLLLYAFLFLQGVIATPTANAIFDASGKLAIAPALENIAVWNVKQGVLAYTLPGEKAEVTVLVSSPDQKHIAAGYADGRVRMWDVLNKTCTLTLNGHRSAVTMLRFNISGSLLVSGSKDTDVIVWDPLAESGLFRLRGHKADITDCRFLEKGTHRHLVTSAKDGFVKIWDLDTQHCVQTLVGHQGEVWSLDVNGDETRMVTGSTDKLLRVWRLKGGATETDAAAASEAALDGKDSKEAKKVGKKRKAEAEPPATPAANDNDETKDEIAEFWGEIERTSRKRVISLRFNAKGTLLGCHGSDKCIDFFRVRTEAEVVKKIKRRAKRQREKDSKTGRDKKEKAAAAAMDTTEDGGPVDMADAIPSDEFEAMLPLRTTAKVASFCFSPLSAIAEAAGAGAGARAKRPEDRVLVSVHSNAIEVFDVRLDAESKDQPYTATAAVELPGHRSGVRSVALSADDSLLMSTSADQIKIWNTSTRNCIRTLASGFGLCSVFVPGNRYIIIGTKTGDLEVWELASGSLIQKIQAHAGHVWSIDVRPNGRGIASGGGDKEVKFWDFELLVPEEAQAEAKASGNTRGLVKKLSLVHVRTLKLTDEVLCLKHSPDGRYIAVGMLDSTVRIFFEDSLKFFLALYGHKLPVIALDISSDSTLLVSGSSDKNVKIWGLDFGDCHKSMFAHDDTVMRVQFVPRTHYFFSVGKDKKIKQWDADRFEHIITLDGHQAEVWGLAVSATGDFIATGGNDRSIRVWKQTDEMLFLDEERDKRMRELYDAGAQTEQKRIGDMPEAGLEAESESGAVAKGKASDETLMAGERLMEALDLVKAEVGRWADYRRAVQAQKEEAIRPKKGLEAAIAEMTGASAEDEATVIAPPVPNPLLMKLSTDAYLFKSVQSIRPAELEEGLMVLPFEYATRLLEHLDLFVRQGWDTELCVRCVLFLISVHQSQIIANNLLADTIASLRRNIRLQLRKAKDAIGFNLAGMRFVKQQLEGGSNAFFFGSREEAEVAKSRPTKRSKRT